MTLTHDGFGKQWFDRSAGGTDLSADAIMDFGQRIQGQIGNGGVSAEKYRVGSNNDEDAILLALDEAAAGISTADAQVGSGRPVLLPHTTYEIAGRIQPDRLVDIRGAGKRATRIICTTAGAGIDFGHRLGDFDVGGSGSTLGYRGGNSGGFVIDGGGIATAPLVIGRSWDRQFIDMKVMKSAGDGALITGTQNCGFFGFDVDDCVGSTVVFDGGAGNNRFYSGHFTRWDDYALKSQQAINDADDAAAFPFANIFHGCIFEFVGSVPRGTDGNSNGHVLFNAGQWFGFDTCNFAGDYDNPTTWFVCETDNATSVPVCMIRLRNPRFFPAAADSVFELRTTASFPVIVLEGQAYFGDGATLFTIADGAQVKILGDLIKNAGTTLFAHYGGGTSYQGDLLQGPPGIADPPWIAMPWATNVGDSGGSAQVGQYRKWPSGKVELRGQGKNNTGGTLTAGSTVATLPSGFRPATGQRRAGTVAALFAEFDIQTTGAIVNQTAIADTSVFSFTTSFYTS